MKEKLKSFLLSSFAFWLITIMLVGVVIFSLIAWHKGGGNPYAQIPVAILFYGMFWLVAYVTRKAYLKECDNIKERIIREIIYKLPEPNIEVAPKKRRTRKVKPVETPTEEIQQTNTTEKSNDNI